MAAAGAAMGFGKKAALAAAGLFSGVGGAVAYKLDQVLTVYREHPRSDLTCALESRRYKLSSLCMLLTSPGPTVATSTPWITPASGVVTRYISA